VDVLRTPRRGPPRTRDEYRVALEAAVAKGRLSNFPPAVIRQLIDRGVRLDAKARTILYREGDAPMFIVIVHGTLRVFATADDGREFTVFWTKPGGVVGQATVAGGPIDLCAQALTDVVAHVMPVELVESLARSDAATAWALLEMTSARVRQMVGFLRMMAFQDLRGRVSQRLTELTFRQPPEMGLVVEVTQQELADSVGSPRTSIARVLAELREEGLIRTVPRGIEIVRLERLVPGPKRSAVA